LWDQLSVASDMQPLAWDWRPYNVLRCQVYSTRHGAVINEDWSVVDWWVATENRITLRKSYISTTFSITDLTWSHLRLNPGLRDEKPTSSLQSMAVSVWFLRSKHSLNKVSTTALYPKVACYSASSADIPKKNTILTISYSCHRIRIHPSCLNEVEICRCRRESCWRCYVYSVVRVKKKVGLRILFIYHFPSKRMVE
jgi:hypothetical protein